jgi:hypothetical protein
VKLTEPVADGAVVPWLTKRGASPSSAQPDSVLRQFPDGGVFIVRTGGNYLYLDLGEVGLKGRGGHGHNDALNFELALGGAPFLIDPGTPCYTGDLGRHSAARSTASHNVLRIDGEEQAPMSGPWSIGNDAAVRNRSVSEEPGLVTVAAEHCGYSRLPDPVVHRRIWLFKPAHGHLKVIDRLECRGPHRVERFLHFAPGVGVTLEQDGATISFGREQRARLLWGGASSARHVVGWVAHSYGSELPSEVLVLEDTVEGFTELELLIEPEAPRSSP